MLDWSKIRIKEEPTHYHEPPPSLIGCVMACFAVIGALIAIGWSALTFDPKQHNDIVICRNRE